jgi:hypothetical protein
MFLLLGPGFASIFCLSKSNVIILLLTDFDLSILKLQISAKSINIFYHPCQCHIQQHNQIALKTGIWQIWQYNWQPTCQ